MAIPSVPAMPRTLLDAVLAYIDTHPRTESLPPRTGSLTLCRHDNATVSIMGDVPEVLDMSAELLNAEYLLGVDFNEGVLTICTTPERLRYRPLGRCEFDFAVRFQRIYDEVT